MDAVADDADCSWRVAEDAMDKEALGVFCVLGVFIE